MKFPAFALLDRSLRVETRSVLMCLARCALPGIILVCLAGVASTLRYGVFGAPGLRVFESVMWLNFFFATLAGLSYFASAVAEEKEEMTLGLLRMTNLSPLAILLGKSTSRLIGAVIMLLVQLPFTLLAVSLGGISVLQVIAAYGVLLAYIFFLCNLALVWSVMARLTTHAAMATGVCVAVYLLGPTLWIEGLRLREIRNGLGNEFTQWLIGVLEAVKSVSPFETLALTFRTGAPLQRVWVQAAVHVALGVGCFALSRRLFDRFTRDQTEAAPSRIMLWKRGGRSSRVPPDVLGGKALTWKDNRLLQGGMAGVVCKTVLLALIYTAVACAPRMVVGRITRDYVGGSFMVLSLFTIALAMAADAARIFREEVRWKTMTSLMVLPLSVREIAYRKVASSLLGLLPVLGLFVIGALIHPKGVAEFNRNVLSDGRAFLFFVAFICQFVLFLHLVAYLSLVVKRGALPLAIGIYYAGSMFVFMPLLGAAAFFARQMGQGIMWLLTMAFTLVLTARLHWKIGRRLVRAAGEE